MSAKINKNKINVDKDKFKIHHLNRLKKLRDVFNSSTKVKNGYVMDLGNNRVLFDIDDFSYNKDTECVFSEDLRDNLNNKFNCNSAACVIGTAGLIPEFRKAGLKTNILENDVVFTPRNGYDNKVHSFNAFGEFFGCGGITEDYIILPSSYYPRHDHDYPVPVPVPKKPTTQDVVARLNVLIQKGEEFLNQRK